MHSAAPDMLSQCEGLLSTVDVVPPVAPASSMWSFILYVAAVSVGLLLYMFYEPAPERSTEDDDDDDISITSSHSGSLRRKTGTMGTRKSTRRYREHQREQQQRFQLSSLFAALGLRSVFKHECRMVVCL